jgi:nucleoside-diphosphate-sugar epimerase
MKIAITGGTGFVGRNIARFLVKAGHEVVLLARGLDTTDPNIRETPNVQFVPLGLDSMEQLARAFAGCQAVAHCAGINREIGTQTYERIHVAGTRNVVTAAQKAGVQKVVLISFLRARARCGSAYHESKWAAEEIVRGSGLDYTVFKCGVIYGQGDHMLNHLSHAFYTFPLFAFVGFRDKSIRPNAVEDVVRLAASALTGGLSRRTIAVLGTGGTDTTRRRPPRGTRCRQETANVSYAIVVPLHTRLVCGTIDESAARFGRAGTNALGRARRAVFAL